MYYVKYFSFTLKKKSRWTVHHNSMCLSELNTTVNTVLFLLWFQWIFHSLFRFFCILFIVIMVTLHVSSTCIINFSLHLQFFFIPITIHNIHCVCCSSFTMPMASPCSSENSNHVGQNMGSWLTSHAINNTIKVLILFIISLY